MKSIEQEFVVTLNYYWFCMRLETAAKLSWKLSEKKLKREYIICRKFLSVLFFQTVYLRNNPYSSLTLLQDP